MIIRNQNLQCNVVTEELKVFTIVYPKASQIHDALMHTAATIDYPNTNKTNVKASMSDWCIDSPEITSLVDWVVHRLAIIDMNTTQCGAHIVHTWFANYNEGDHTDSHTHYPLQYSFVYFVHSPPGSSPLVFTHSNLSIDPTPGTMVIFPGNLKHHVDTNKSTGRLVLAGNFLFTPPDIKVVHDQI